MRYNKECNCVTTRTVVSSTFTTGILYTGAEKNVCTIHSKTEKPKPIFVPTPSQEKLIIGRRDAYGSRQLGCVSRRVWQKKRYIRTKNCLFLNIMKVLNLSNSRLGEGVFFSATLAHDLLVTDESHMRNKCVLSIPITSISSQKKKKCIDSTQKPDTWLQAVKLSHLSYFG